MQRNLEGKTLKFLAILKLSRTKNSRSTQCTVHCAVTKEESWKFNESRDDQDEVYSREIFDALWVSLKFDEINAVSSTRDDIANFDEKLEI